MNRYIQETKFKKLFNETVNKLKELEQTNKNHNGNIFFNFLTPRQKINFNLMINNQDFFYIPDLVKKLNTYKDQDQKQYKNYDIIILLNDLNNAINKNLYYVLLNPISLKNKYAKNDIYLFIKYIKDFTDFQSFKKICKRILNNDLFYDFEPEFYIER